MTGRRGTRKPAAGDGAVLADKESLRMIFCGALAGMDERSDEYARLCSIVLAALGVERPDGGLADNFRRSPYWIGDGTPGDPLRVSERARLHMAAMRGRI